MDKIVNTSINWIKKLRSEDVVVIWGGTNHVSKNNTKIRVDMKRMCNFVGGGS